MLNQFLFSDVPKRMSHASNLLWQQKSQSQWVLYMRVHYHDAVVSTFKSLWVDDFRCSISSILIKQHFRELLCDSSTFWHKKLNGWTLGANNFNHFLTHQFKHMFWVLNITTSLRWFFWVPITNVLVEK